MESQIKRMNTRFLFKSRQSRICGTTLFLFFLFFLFAFTRQSYNNSVPIYIKEFGVEIRKIDKLGDTIFYKKSSKENFKFIFYDAKGKCYCERYINGKLYQKGTYGNSLDTLRRYVSGRDLNGKRSVIVVQEYFEPLKNGEWITYKDGKSLKENYLMGVLQ